MDVKAARIKNLKALVEREGTIAEVGRRADTAPAYISQILNAAKHHDESRGVGHKLARKIERAYGYDKGWMDRAHDTDAPSVVGQSVSNAPEPGLDIDVLTQILDMIEDRRQQFGDDPQPTFVIAKVIAETYSSFAAEKKRHMQRTRVIDDALNRAARKGTDGRRSQQKGEVSRD